jgi:uncharacterized protein involved in outer membrane biogenesis
MTQTAGQPLKSSNKALLFKLVKAAGWFVLAVTILFGSLLVFLLSSPDTSKSAVEWSLSTLTDREFQINGDFDLTLGESLVIRAKDVAWLNAEWTKTPNMMEVSEIELVISTRSLLIPPVIISSAYAQGATLEFEWTEDDQFNWDFYADEPDDEDDGPLKPLPLLLDMAILQNVELIFKDPLFTEPLHWKIKHAQQKQDDSNLLVITGTTELDGRPVDLQGRIGPFPELVVAGKVQMSVRVQGPAQSLEASADFDNLLELAGTGLDLTWQAPDVAIVLDMFNLPAEATRGPIDLKAHISTADATTQGTVSGNVGQFTVDGDFSAPENNALTDLHTSLRSKGPNASAVGKLIGINGLPTDPYQLEFKLDTVKTGLRISDFYAKTGNAELKLTALLPRPPSLIDADLNLKIRGNDLSRFQGMTDDIQFIAAPFSADFDIKGNGDGTADSLTGKLMLAKMLADVSAKLTESADYTGSTFDYSMTIPDAEKLAGMFGVQLTKTENLSASGKASIEKRGTRLSDLTIKLADNQMILNGLIPRENLNETINLATATSGQSFSGFMSYYLPFDLGPSSPFSLKGNIEIDDDRILISKGEGKVGTTQVQTKGRVDMGANDTDMSLDFSASGPNLDEWLKDLISEERTSEKFQLAAKLYVSDTELKISDMNIEVKDAKLTGNVVSGWPDHPEAFSFDIQAQGQNMAEELPKFTAFEPAAVPFNINARGQLDETHVQLDEFDAKIGSVVANLKGRMGIPPVVAAESLSIDIHGDKLSDLGAFEGFEVEDVAFKIGATINTAGQTINANDVTMLVGPNDLSGQISFEMADKPRVDINLVSKNFDIGAVLTKEQNTALNKTLAGLDDDSSDDNRLIPDALVPVEFLDSFDGSLQLQMDKITRFERELSTLSVQATLKDRTLKIFDLTANTTFGDVTGLLTLKPSGESYTFELGANLNKVRLGDTLAAATDKYPYKGHDIDTWLSGTGLNLRDMAATMDGYFWMRGDTRQIENIKFGSMFGDFFTGLWKRMNPYIETDLYTTIECDRYLFEIEKGKMETSPFILIKTDKLNFLSAGSINLANERLRLGIETEPRTGVGVSVGDLLTPFVRVGGTMSDPKAEVDAKGSVIEGGAAYVTLGLSIVAKGLYQRWVKEDKSCKQYTEIAREIRTKRDPDHVPKD